MSKQELIDYFSSDVEENLLSLDEYIILKNVSENFKWIARDESDFLYLYNTKPYKKECGWDWDNAYFSNFNIYKNLFQFIKWSDDEPYEIEKLLAAYEENEHEK